MAQALAWIELHRRERHEPRLDWTGTHVQVVNQRGEVLARPVGLLPELALLLHDPEPYDLPMIPTMRRGGQRCVA